MALKCSTMLTLGTLIPTFELLDLVSGNIVSPETFSDKKGIMVMFICKHCPYVVHVQEELGRIGRDYEHREIGIVAISSNDVKKYPEDRPDSLKTMAEQMGFTFPVCYDESQETAKSFTAACTPDFFLFGEDRTLVYRGQLDDSRPGNGISVTGRDLRLAVDAMLCGGAVSTDQKPSAGCNIKWKPGNEPTYA